LAFGNGLMKGDLPGQGRNGSMFRHRQLDGRSTHILYFAAVDATDSVQNGDRISLSQSKDMQSVVRFRAGEQHSIVPALLRRKVKSMHTASQSLAVPPRKDNLNGTDCGPLRKSRD